MPDIDKNKFKYYQIEKQFKEGFVERPEIPEYIVNNLNHKFELREYQKEAFQNFITYFEDDRFNHNKQIWTLFHSATGSGKTLIMAGLILYLYKKGYRNFIFFVNQSNIVAKTKENFKNEYSSKFLFERKIVINRRTVEINEVKSFQNIDDTSDDINILFTTIQDLHGKLNNITEYSVSYEDFDDKKIVLISDEAHHINAATKKKLSAAEKEEDRNWEDTINNIFRANRDNVLLEFTATCDLKNPNILEKYCGNPAEIIFNYTLLEFRASGYTKDLFNLRTTLDPITRTIQAMLLSQYRLNLFQDNHIHDTKPVILLKTDGTTDNCDAFFENFKEYMKNELDENVIAIIRNQAKDIIKEMFDYFDSHGLTNRLLVDELKQEFSEEHLIKVHSKVKNINDLQVELNDLENPRVPYRMVFTVDMLHEGWDVLNLFDIVRLYDERKDGTSVSPVTIQEAQLIGRGARYFPFKLNQEIIGAENEQYKRKFDEIPDNPLKVCETLYYHCIDNSKYIYDLQKALEETGFKQINEEVKFEYKLKKDFIESDIYKYGKLFINSYEEKPAAEISKIPDTFTIMSSTNLVKKSSVSKLYERIEEENTIDEKIVERTHKVTKVDKRILLKALRKFPVYEFSRLKSYFPLLKSHSEFLSSKDYAGRYEFVTITSGEPTNEDIYQGALRLFEILSNKILSIKAPLQGTHVFKEIKLSDYIVDSPREKKYDNNEIEQKEGEGISQNAPNINPAYRYDLSDKSWFVYDDNYGTTEEKRFVRYFATQVEELKKVYETVYLIRNERKYHLYSFDDGKRFEPDYILILGNKSTVVEQQQIFIEPKGQHLIDNDIWKEHFLLQLENDSKCIAYPDYDNYSVKGLPFYTHNVKEQRFKEYFEKLYKHN